MDHTNVPPVALTDGVVLLRFPDDRDVATLCAYGQDDDILESGWLPIPTPCSSDTAARTLEEFRRGLQGRFGLTLAVTVPPADDMRGVVHLSARTLGVGEIAYGIAPRYRGLGLATRAVMLLATWALSDAGLTCLEIVITQPGSYGIASRRVAEKAGFTYAGRRRSHVPATGAEYDDPLYVLPAPFA